MTWVDIPLNKILSESSWQGGKRTEPRNRSKNISLSDNTSRLIGTFMTLPSEDFVKRMQLEQQIYSFHNSITYWLQEYQVQFSGKRILSFFHNIYTHTHTEKLRKTQCVCVCMCVCVCERERERERERDRKTLAKIDDMFEK